MAVQCARTSGVRIDQRRSAKSAREEWRGQFDGVMIWLDPRDEGRVLRAADFAEPDEGVHLVDVAAYGLREVGDPANGVGPISSRSGCRRSRHSIR